MPRWRPVGVVWVGSNPIPRRRIGVGIVAIVARGRRIAWRIGRRIVRAIIRAVRRPAWVIPRSVGIIIRIVGIGVARPIPVVGPAPIPAKA